MHTMHTHNAVFGGRVDCMKQSWNVVDVTEKFFHTAALVQHQRYAGRKLENREPSCPPSWPSLETGARPSEKYMYPDTRSEPRALRSPLFNPSRAKWRSWHEWFHFIKNIHILQLMWSKHSHFVLLDFKNTCCNDIFPGWWSRIYITCKRLFPRR